MSKNFQKTEYRLKERKKVKRELKEFSSLPLWDQCIVKHINGLKLIGKGSYGNVFKKGNDYAIKVSRIKNDAILDPFSRNHSSWMEVFFLQEIFYHLIKTRKCPNLPLIYESFACRSCELNLEGEKKMYPCVITAIELANGDLKKYLSKNPNDDEICSALFQVMAALATIQTYGQIMNFDVKKENVLFYKIPAGGYWEYIIMGKSFIVPNYGYMFILNDFGISRSMSPEYIMYKNEKDQTFRLGSRYAFIKDGKFVPLSIPQLANCDGNLEASPLITWNSGEKSFGSEFRIRRSTGKIISNNANSCFVKKKTFLSPNKFPPFEYYNDTQDAIRMIIGGKRTTQRGSHIEYTGISSKLKNKLKMYIGKGESMANRVFSTDPAQVCASYFITSFFTFYQDSKVAKDIIETFRIK